MCHLMYYVKILRLRWPSQPWGNFQSILCQNEDSVCAWPAPGIQAADRLDPSKSQQSDRWRDHVGQKGWQGAHLRSSFWKGTGPSSQAIFFLPRSPVWRVMKSAIGGECAFLTVRNPTMTDCPLHCSEGCGCAAGGCEAGWDTAW